MHIVIYLIIIGAAAGFVATRLMRLNTGIVETVAIGIAGALVGGFVLRFLMTAGGMMGGLVGAVLGSLALIWVWKTYFRR